MNINDLNRLLQPLAVRVSNMVARAVVRLVDDAKKLQTLQLEVLAGEVRDGCERFQQFGFTAVPKEGAEAAVLFVGGRRDHPLIVAVDDRRYRMKSLAAGEAAVYNDLGEYVHVKHGRVIVASPELRLGADSASDFVALATATNARLAHLELAFNSHVHAVAGAVGTATVPLAVPGVIPVETALPAGSGVVGSVASSKVKAE